MTDTFKCSTCGKEFLKELSDDEAEDQLKNEFPDWDSKDCGIVCDDCYQTMFGAKDLS